MFIIRKKNSILKTGSFLWLRYIISRAWSHEDNSSSLLSHLPVASQSVSMPHGPAKPLTIELVCSTMTMAPLKTRGTKLHQQKK